MLHVPGHSHGHLALYDAAHKTAFVSDAIHGRGCPKADGSMGIPVTYFYIDLYLSTLTYLEGLLLEHLHTGHWPSMQGDEIRDFFNDSRKTVEILDRKIVRTLSQSRAGLTLSELMDAGERASRSPYNRRSGPHGSPTFSSALGDCLSDSSVAFGTQR